MAATLLAHAAALGGWIVAPPEELQASDKAPAELVRSGSPGSADLPSAALDSIPLAEPVLGNGAPVEPSLRASAEPSPGSTAGGSTSADLVVSEIGPDEPDPATAVLGSGKIATPLRTRASPGYSAMEVALPRVDGAPLVLLAFGRRRSADPQPMAQAFLLRLEPIVDPFPEPSAASGPRAEAASLRSDDAAAEAAAPAAPPTVAGERIAETPGSAQPTAAAVSQEEPVVDAAPGPAESADASGARTEAPEPGAATDPAASAAEQSETASPPAVPVAAEQQAPAPSPAEQPQEARQTAAPPAAGALPEPRPVDAPEPALTSRPEAGAETRSPARAASEAPADASRAKLRTPGPPARRAADPTSTTTREGRPAQASPAVDPPTSRGRRSEDGLGLSEYSAKLRTRLARAKRYPAEARKANLQGTALVRIVIARSGALQAFSLQASSGHAILDAEALALVRRAAPFEPLPAAHPGPIISFLAPIAFNAR